MDCPCCGHRLAEVQHRGIDLGRCPTCKGVWIDPERLESYRRVRDDSSRLGMFERIENNTSLTCPRCQATTLVLGEARSVRLYECSKCSGFFLPSQSLASSSESECEQSSETAADGVIAGLDILWAFLSFNL